MHQHDSAPLRAGATFARLQDGVRRLTCAAAMLAAAGMLAACGGGGGSSGGTSSSGTSTAASATPASAASSANDTSAASGASAASSAAAASGASATTSAATSGSTTTTTGGATAVSAARTLPASPVWTVYYGRASNIDLAQTASTFDVIVIDADPGTGTPSFSAAQIAALKANGAKVLSYLNFGACEKSRSYWNTAPSGFVSCGANTTAQIAKYSGYNEYWMNPSNADYQNLIVNYIAPRLAATGVDGFMLDNFEIVGHGTKASQTAPCDATCTQGGLDLVKQLRDRFPDLAIVANAAPVSAIGGTTGGVSFPYLIDGVLAEQVFLPSTTNSLVTQLRSWQSTEQNLGRSGFFVGTLDYASSCSDTTTAQSAWTASQQAGFSPAVATSALSSICWWPFLTTGT
jgi:cysteinyl-tRNA synthetase, unknown class